MMHFTALAELKSNLL